MARGYVYILKSEKNGRYYVGSTKDIRLRFEQHCKGKVKATKCIRPLKIAFFQQFDTLQRARKVEYKLKHLKRRDILERIIEEKYIKM